MDFSELSGRKRFELEYLMHQLVRFNGNIREAAAFVSMDPSAVEEKLRSLGVSSFEPASLKASLTSLLDSR
jgi:DNA-binding NtrC family response regulator